MMEISLMGMGAEELVTIGRAIADPRSYANRAVVEAGLARLRADDPVARIVIDGYDPFWIVTRHADVLAASKANDAFLYSERQSILVDAKQDALDREQSGGGRKLVRALTEMDAPEHMKYRLLTQGWFQPKNLRAREDRIRAAARRSVDKLLAQGEDCDFVADLAATYPLHVVMDVLGVPVEDEPKMLEWAKQLIAGQDPEMRRQDLGPDVDPHAARMKTLGEMFSYYGALTAARRASPRDDVASVISNAMIDGSPIGDMEAMAYYVIIATAGHDTTAGSTAAAIWQLAENPALLARVKADPGLIPALIDEAIRFETPVQHFMRTAARDIEFGGVEMAKGDWVMLSYLSGNRDEAVFDDPDRFSLDRNPNRHLAFGYGAHLCLGQHLAKMEMRILFEDLLPRIGSLQFSGTPTRIASHFVSGPKRMPMRINPA